MKFFEPLYKLDSEKKYRHSAEYIVNNIDELLRNGNFEECNAIFENANISKLSKTSLVSMLGITLAAKDKLPARKEFYEKANKAVKSKQSFWERIFSKKRISLLERYK